MIRKIADLVLVVIRYKELNVLLGLIFPNRLVKDHHIQAAIQRMVKLLVPFPFNCRHCPIRVRIRIFLDPAILQGEKCEEEVVLHDEPQFRLLVVNQMRQVAHGIIGLLLMPPIRRKRVARIGLDCHRFLVAEWTEPLYVDDPFEHGVHILERDASVMNSNAALLDGDYGSRSAIYAGHRGDLFVRQHVVAELALARHRKGWQPKEAQRLATERSK